MQSKSENAIVKATYGGKTRKWRLSGSNFSSLVDAVRNEFGIESADLHLKYKDSGKQLTGKYFYFLFRWRLC
jgi:hypothetical protein